MVGQVQAWGIYMWMVPDGLIFRLSWELRLDPLCWENPRMNIVSKGVNGSWNTLSVLLVEKNKKCKWLSFLRKSQNKSDCMS